MMIPIKLSKPSGSSQISCFSDDEYFIAVNHVSPLMSMLPYYHGYYTLNNGGGNSNWILVRSARSYSKPPVMDFLEYILNLAVNLNDVILNTKLANYDIQIIEDLYNSVKCLRGEEFRIGAGLLPKISTEDCIESLLSIHSNMWSKLTSSAGLFNPLLTRKTGIQIDFTDKGVSAVLNGFNRRDVDPYANSLKLHTAIMLGLFVRDHVYIDTSGQDHISFSLPESVKKADTLPAGRIAADFFKLFYGSYSGIANIPLVQWYANAYGIELPPASLRAYRIFLMKDKTIGRLNPRETHVPVVWSDLKEYGDHSIDTLERNTRRRDLDSVAMSAAIDIYSGWIVNNIWHRSVVHTLMYNSIKTHRGEVGCCGLGKGGGLVLPVLVPRDFVREKISMVPVPLSVTQRIDSFLLDKLHSTFYYTNTINPSDEEVSETAISLMRQLNYARKGVEFRYVRKIRGVLGRLGWNYHCLKSMIVEVVHPVSGYIMFDEIVTRTVAEIPSIHLKENLLRYLMERLTDADTFKVFFYFVLDPVNVFSRELREKIDTGELETFIHQVYYPNPDKPGFTISLERISREIVLQEGTRLVNEKCKEELRFLADTISREVL